MTSAKTCTSPSAQPIQWLAPAALRGRGTGWAITPRFSGLAREPIDDGWLDAAMPDDALGQAPRTQIIEQSVKSILSGNDSPDISFDVSINPYRGCEHGCIYCYARPTHSYLDFSPGLEFETRIVAKVNAAARLRQALTARGYSPLALCIGAATDAYQPAERRLRITRSILEVLAQCHHPFSLITKSAGVERDLDLIAPMGRDRLAAVFISITTLDPALARILEPRAASPQRRLQTIARLADAGVPVGVSVSPVIPFINEPELESIAKAAAQAGATRAFSIPLRLPWEVNPLFQQWLEQHFPDRARRVMARVRDLRGGRDNDARFGHRMHGQGLWAQLLHDRWQRALRVNGLSAERFELDTSRFCASRLDPVAARQAPLF